MGTEAAAIAAGVGLGAIAVFQLAIALGAPLGEASWGGTHRGVLPPNLRAASAVAVLVWSFAALVSLGRAGLGPLSGSWLDVAAWVVVGILALGAIMNAASSSRWERFGWSPFALVLAALSAVVAS